MLNCPISNTATRMPSAVSLFNSVGELNSDSYSTIVDSPSLCPQFAMPAMHSWSVVRTSSKHHVESSSPHEATEASIGPQMDIRRDLLGRIPLSPTN